MFGEYVMNSHHLFEQHNTLFHTMNFVRGNLSFIDVKFFVVDFIK